MKRSVIAFMTVPLLLLGFVPQAQAEDGDGHALAGIDVIERIKDPDEVHLRLQRGLDYSQYADATQVARAYGTNITAIRERNLGTTLARCRQDGLSMVRRTHHLKEPPPITQQDVFNMRARNGLWTDCPSTENQVLVLIQGEDLYVPVGSTAIPTAERIEGFNRLSQCTTFQCVLDEARKAKAKIPPGAGTAFVNPTTPSQGSVNVDMQQRIDGLTRDLESESANNSRLTNALKQANAKLAVLTRPHPYSRWWVVLSVLGAIGVMYVVRYLLNRWHALSTSLDAKWQRVYESKMVLEKAAHQQALEALKQRLTEKDDALKLANHDHDQEMALRKSAIERLEREAEQAQREHRVELEVVSAELRTRNVENEQLNAKLDEAGAAMTSLTGDLQMAQRDLENVRSEKRTQDEMIRLGNARIQEMSAEATANAAKFEARLAEKDAEAAYYAAQAGTLAGQWMRDRESLWSKIEGLRAANDNQLAEIGEYEGTISLMQSRAEMQTQAYALLSDDLAERGRKLEALEAEVVRLREPVVDIKEQVLGPVDHELLEQLLLKFAGVLETHYKVFTGKDFPLLPSDLNEMRLKLAELADEMQRSLKVGSEAYRSHAVQEASSGLVELGKIIDGNPTQTLDEQLGNKARMEELRRTVNDAVTGLLSFLRVAKAFVYRDVQGMDEETPSQATSSLEDIVYTLSIIAVDMEQKLRSDKRSSNPPPPDAKPLDPAAA